MFMRETGDSSVWKSLAVAFGDGLAFGVGVKLSQNAQRAALAPADNSTILNRLDWMEQRIRQIEAAPAAAEPAPPAAAFDHSVLEAITAALDARLSEHTSQVERRLADMEARMLLDTKALEQQDRSLASRMEQDLATLKGQVIALNREFAEQVGRIVAEQVSAQVAARTSGLEHSIRTHAMDAADDAVQERLAPMRAEVSRKEQELTELREHIAATDTTVFDFILAMGEMCRQAAERLTPPAAPGPQVPAPEAPRIEPVASAVLPEEPAPEPQAPSSAPAAAEDTGAELREHFDRPAEPPAPSFTEVRKPAGFWRMPMVSSFVAVIASLAMLRFL